MKKSLKLFAMRNKQLQVGFGTIPGEQVLMNSVRQFMEVCIGNFFQMHLKNALKLLTIPSKTTLEKQLDRIHQENHFINTSLLGLTNMIVSHG